MFGVLKHCLRAFLFFTVVYICFATILPLFTVFLQQQHVLRVLYAFVNGGPEGRVAVVKNFKNIQTNVKKHVNNCKQL